MEIEVKGHSGCDIEVVNENDNLYVYKSSYDKKYLKRLVLQAQKQIAAAIPEYQYVRVPKILDIAQDDEKVVLKMEYVYSKNFVEYFEHAGFEQINYLVIALIKFLEYEIKNSPITTVDASIVKNKFTDVKAKTLSNIHLQGDAEIAELLEKSAKVFAGMHEMNIPVGLCHGDLTFSNILFNGNNYYLIDFLDSFIESPLLDIVKIRQDSAYLWSQLMYIHECDTIRLNIICHKIDQEIDKYFSQYAWYNEYYMPLQLMNFLRILQYAHEEKVITYLKTVINDLLEKF
jgi:tRNA A-37 threonylcarbamoyl transferase component Bud32